MTEPTWDGEERDGRPVANCQECGALRYAEDIEYIGEAALGGPNFTYRLGELAAPVLDVERLAQALTKDFGPSYFPGLEDVTIIGTSPRDVAEQIAAEYARLSGESE